MIEVWSRLWPSTVVGGRSYRNTLALFRDVSERMNPGQLPLITTDGFEFYKKVIGRIFGPACLYGQVIKTRRNDRIVKVERRTVIGGAWGLQQALLFETEHVLYQTPEPHHPTGLGISIPTDDLSGAMEGTSRRSSLFAWLPSQLRKASQGAKMWTTRAFLWRRSNTG